MRDSRIGESLWTEWYGYGYLSNLQDSIIFSTIDHVDLDNDVVRRALASSLQREGIASSLGEGYRIVDTAFISHGYAGHIDESYEYYVSDEQGTTYSGDSVDEALPMTWVEFP
jgi:ABC-type transport system substrate-binding protein